MDVIGNIKYVTGVTSYLVSGGDGTINVDTSANAVTIILPNILNSGYFGTTKGFIINDISNNASVNNITIVAADNTVNSASSVSINQNGGTAKCSIASQDEWFIVREPESGGYTPPYKVYTALLTQNGTDAPVATVLENTLGGTLVWTRQSSGNYFGTLVGAFSEEKTFSLYNMVYNPVSDSTIGFGYWDNDSVYFYTRTELGDPVDGVLGFTSIEIRVYN